MKLTKLITLSLLSGLIAASAHAQGERGNGDGVIKVNGTVRIADPYLESNIKTTPFRLNAELIAELKNIQGLMISRGLEVSDLFSKDIFADDTRYWFSDQLPCQDLNGLKTIHGSAVQAFACTQDKITYVQKSTFDLLSLREQALGIIHERIHAFYPNHPHVWITQVVGGMQLALELRDEQREGVQRVLLTDELARLNELAHSAEELGFGSFMTTSRSFIHPYGGGLVDSEFASKPEDKLGANVFVSIESRIFNRNSTFPMESIRNLSLDRSTITIAWENQNCESTFHDSKLVDSKVEGCSAVSDSRLFKSKLDGAVVNHSALVHTELEQSTVSDSTFEDCSGSYIAKSATCSGTVQRGAYWLYGHTEGSIKLEPGSKISGSRIYNKGHKVNLKLEEGVFIDSLLLNANDNGGMLKFKNSELNLNFTRSKPYFFQKSVHYCANKKKGFSGWAEKVGLNIESPDDLEICKN